MNQKRLILIGLAVLCIACTRDEPAHSTSEIKPTTVQEARSLVQRPDVSMDQTQSQIFKTNFAEELVLNLTPRLKLLEQKLRGNSPDLKTLFDTDIQYLGPADFDLNTESGVQNCSQNQLAARSNWPLQDSKKDTAEISARFWAPILSQGSFEDTQFGILESKLLEESDVFEMKTIFEGRFLNDQQAVFGIKAKQTIQWVPVDEKDWKISSWIQESIKLIATERPLFEDVTATAIVDEKVRETITRSKHEELLLRRASNKDLLATHNPVFQFFTDWTSLFQYTSASVVDIDQDEWDDIFILDRLGESVLLRNKGDGTFEDISRKCGLKLGETFANCALFADFDNDGDSDCLIGRTLQRSLYYENVDGKFKPVERINRELNSVRFVSAGSVADINCDGLLDVYLSTYSTRSGTDTRWIHYAVPPREQPMLFQKVTNGHAFLDRAGPPNVLMMNKRGRLTIFNADGPLKQWRNSFQSIWTDYDDDGDPDLYLCNDFAPDVLLRNDTKKGSFDIKFTDVTQDVFVGNSLGFGMGASFGDYNSDGKMDLYVSNMYSKAGNRIIQHLDGDVDPRVAISTRGNFLYQFTDGKFEHVAGLEPGKQHVSKVGWSFGGQLADFNNDRKLDAYVPSGFFSAPETVAEQFDL